MRVRRAGFKKYERDGITLAASQIAAVNPILEVGEITETVEVGASPPLVNTQTTEVSTLIDTQQIKELPISGRNWASLMLLAPGRV